jgi:hypothetical protein
MDRAFKTQKQHTGGASSFSSSPTSGRAERFENTPSDCMPPPTTRGRPVAVLARGPVHAYGPAMAVALGSSVRDEAGSPLDAASSAGAPLAGCRTSRWRTSSASSSSLASPSDSNASARVGSTGRSWRRRIVVDEARERNEGGGDDGCGGG